MTIDLVQTSNEKDEDSKRMSASSVESSTTSLYCPQPKRSTSPFMSLREVNERINSPTLLHDTGKHHSFHFDTPDLTIHKTSEGGSFTVLPLSQSKKVRRQMEVVRGTRRIRTLIGETKLARPAETSSSSATTNMKNKKPARVRYRGSRRPQKNIN